jgi:diacylglycerol kinase family enzyme
MQHPSSTGPGSSVLKRRPKNKPDADIILICNPRAGGRWKELAAILDSEEARHTRRIVTDSVEDIAPAVAELGREAKLLCVYGGDGTIQRVLDRLSPTQKNMVQLALIGGGTMNVTARWCGFTRSPAENFRAAVQAYRSGNLLLKEVPLLQVRRGGRSHRGFTFGMGPIVRVLDAYEQGKKGKIAAVSIALQSVAAAWLKRPARYRDLLAEMEAELRLDGEVLPYGSFSAVFANVTGQINPGVVPFVDSRTRDSFFIAAYAVSARELALALPMVMRGWMPMDLTSLLKPADLLRRTTSDQVFPTDPRYVNSTASVLEIRTSEPLYTIDGEILSSDEPEIRVELGPVLRLAVSPTAGLRPGFRIAADAIGAG